MLDGWKLDWQFRVPRSKFPANALARTISDCEWYLAFNINAGACMSSAEVERVKQLGKNTAWG
jgi:hypothetical protein